MILEIASQMPGYLRRNTVDRHMNRLPPKLKESASNAKPPPKNRIRWE
jgi:hypothetical protein